MVDISVSGLRELIEAVRKNPEQTRRSAARFLQRSMAGYRRTITSAPWRMGDTRGGSPVAAEKGGRLRRTHRFVIGPWEGRIYPTAPYAAYVHGIEGYPRKRTYRLRPWLDFAVDANAILVRDLEKVMLQEIVGGLAR